MRAPFLGSSLFLCQIGLTAMGVAVNSVVSQGVRGIQNPFNCFDAVPFFALGDIVARKTQIVENTIGIGPLSEQVIILEEMIMTKCSMRHDERLHRHGIFFHDIADARIGIDDDFVGEALQPATVEGLVKGEALAETPMPIHQREADGGIGVEHLLGSYNLDLNRVDI